MSEENLECNFCSKKRTEVVKLVAGAGVYICDECIILCNDIIKDDRKKPLKDIETVIPSELKEFFVPGFIITSNKKLLYNLIGALT